MTALPAANYFNDNARTEGEIKLWGEDIRQVIAELMGGAAIGALTIASGAIVPTTAIAAVDTEAAASTDDLDTITATNHPSGRFFWIWASNSARTVVVKHSASPGAGQISLNDGADFSIDDAKKSMLLRYNGTYWVEVLRDWGGDTSALRTWLGVKIGTDVQAYDADTAKLDVAQEWAQAQSFNQAALTDGATIGWNAATQQVAGVTIAGNRTMAAPTNIPQGRFISVRVKQDGTGSRTLSWNTVFKFPGGTAPTLSTAANAVDLFIFWCDGTNCELVGQSLDVK